MPAQLKLTPNQINLIRRYLLWCYKTTKEDLDRLERYDTQYLVDQNMFKQLGAPKNKHSRNAEYQKLVGDFKEYLENKKNAADQKKYKDVSKKEFSAQYLYLKSRLAAIEKAIVDFLGKKDLKNIVGMYEAEMTQRILTAREHS